LRRRVQLRKSILEFGCLGPARSAMNRFVHRIILSVLLVAALAVIWNVLGAR
jgi:hypothetical protein